MKATMRTFRMGWFVLLSLALVVMSACGGGGGGAGGVVPPSGEVPVILGQPGPGDTENRFPFAVGNIWVFQGTSVETGVPGESFQNSVTISGTRPIAGVEAAVFTESNPGNLGISVESFLFKDLNGIVNFGNSDPDDPLTAQLVPFWESRPPLTPGSSFVQLNRTGVNLGDDLDLDGINEVIDIHSVVRVVGFETVTVPVGTFADCVKIEKTMNMTFRFSSSGARVTVIEVATSWLAPNVGWVKRVQSISESTIGFNSTVTEELTGFLVDGNGKGLMPPFAIAENVAAPDSDTTRPGRSAVGFDGTNYLLVSCRDSGIPAGLFGRTVSESGSLLNEFQITADGCPANPAVAFGGGNFLVTFDRGGQIFGTRVSPGGAVVGDPAGFPISTSAPGSSTNFSSALAFDGVNFLVVWNKFVNNDNHEIFGSRVTPAGTVLDEFEIFSAPGEQIFPAVAFDGVNYLVAWRDTRPGSGPTLDTDIFGTRVTPAGDVLDPGGIAIATAPGFQGDQPQIAFDGTNYLVVWTDMQTLGTSPPVDARIMGRRIAPDGTLLDGPADTAGIAIHTTPSSHSPAVAFDGENFLVAWAVGSFPNFPPVGIFAARVSSTGVLLDGPPEALALSVSGPPPFASRFVHPVMCFGARNSLVSWVNNSELFGTPKSIKGAFIFPF